MRRTVVNLPVRVPARDWPAVATGQKGMFRAYSERGGDRERPLVPPGTECPRPCLLFAVRYDGPGRSRRFEALPGVLLAHRQEPLGAISPEDLEREGFGLRLPAFRYYWRRRYPKVGWRPWDMVSVIEVRPWQHGDDGEQGAWLLRRLYGDWRGGVDG